MNDRKNSMVASAMHYAIFLGLFWVFKYIFVILGDTSDRSLAFASMLTIITPVLYYILVCRYRDNERGGKIDYGDVILFSMLLVLFASFIELVAVCLRIFVINPSFLAHYIQQVSEQYNQSAFFDMLAGDQKELMAQMMDFQASNIGVIFILSNLIVNFFIGLFLSLILGYFIAKKNPNTTPKI